MRAAIYARYSSDMQRDASIEDQFRLCREHAVRQGWTVADSYSDRAISGASLLRRPGLQKLIADASRGGIDIILAEAMDRLSRDLEDIAGLYKRLNFVGVLIQTIAEGEINEMQVGMKGTMNALFLKDLAQKTHRGLRGRVEAGKSGGGNSYGYRVTREFGLNGLLEAGGRQVDPAQSELVRRIFRDFANGKSPRAIAHALNKEAFAGPRGQAWGQSTINGNKGRGTGILNNELYIGRLVWNRLRYMKDPSTGKRISRLNHPESWIVKDVPELRIIDQDLWQAVKVRQSQDERRHFRPRAALDGLSGRDGFWTRQRPRYLLTGLMKCGACGGGYSKISANLFGCAAVRNKGTCENRLNIRTDTLESIVFDGLKHRLMAPELFREFAAAFVAEHNTIVAQQNGKLDDLKAELARVKARQKVLVNALVEGVPARSVREEMIGLEAREDELNAGLSAQPSSKPSLLPNLAELHREKIAALHLSLSDPAVKDEAFGIIRTLIDEVRLVPEDGKLRVELRGALAGILRLANNDKSHRRVGADGSVSVLIEQVKLVAGARFERAAFRL